MTSLEIDTIKQENQEKEKKYFEDTEIVKGKYDLRKPIKREAAETLRDNPFQHNEQFNNITCEIRKLNFQTNRETEIKSYHDRLTAAPSCPHESQTSKLASQRARDEYLHPQTEMNCNNSHRKINSEVFSQELVKYERKIDSLQNKLCQIEQVHEEITLVFENVQRNLSKIECHMKKVIGTWQTKMNEYYGKQNFTKRSKLRTENTLVQQLQAVYNKTDSKDTVTHIQGECHDVVENFQVSNKEHNLILEKDFEKLSNKWSHSEESLHPYKNEKTEGQVARMKTELPLKENSK